MSQPTIHVKIVSPSQTLFEGEAVSLSSKNSQGNFDILAQHANFLTMTVNSPIIIVTPDSKKLTFKIPLAIVYSSENKVSVYTDIILKWLYTKLMDKRVLITMVTVVIMIVAAGAAIFITKGYSFSAQQGRIVGTGIISVASTPTGASVYIDGHLTTATDTTIPSLSPKIYSIKITKEGFIPWEKQVKVNEGLVTEVEATLFPSIPTIYPLTYNGVVDSILSTDGKQLAFSVPLTDQPHNRQKGGVWVWTFESGPIAFARGAQPHQIVTSTQSLDFAKAKLAFSPDSSQVLLTLYEGTESPANLRNYLLPVNSKTAIEDLRDVTATVETLTKGWKDDQLIKEMARLEIIKDSKIKNIASQSADIKWSPDETKFLSKSKIFDLGSVEDLNPTTKEYQLPEALSYSWLPSSKHVILIQSDDPKNPATGKIVLCDFDASNCVVLYSGTFKKEAIYAWPDASRLMLITSFNTPTASTPNLFGINLK